MLTTTTTPIEVHPTQALADLVRRAMEGDTATLPALREFLDAHPEVVHEAGNLVGQARTAWTNLAAGNNLLVAEAIGREQVTLKDSLGWASATSLERLLIDQITLAQLEIGYASTRDAQAAGQPLSVGQRDHLQRRTARAHQRLMASVKMLTTIRRLRPSPSPVQVAARFARRGVAAELVKS
ncbi:MAG: hypothetical protein JNM56_25105 [Planctomycetia bacterium]|nr:hypothetical protein [Planctomycetia bacterium]